MVSCLGDFFVLGDSGIAGMMNAKKRITIFPIRWQ